jgi:hypothetical protein
VISLAGAGRVNRTIMIRLIAVLIVGALQAGAAPTRDVDSARFRYLLPEGPNTWVCVDFGVAGAPPLKQDDHGTVEIIGRRNEIVATSSLSGLTRSPFASEVLRFVDGQLRRVEVSQIQQRFTYDTKSPVSRACLFFGSAEDARKVNRPPTLTETKNAVSPLSELFEFKEGSVCNLKEESRFCVDARDAGKSDVASILAGMLRKAPGRTVSTKCSGTFEGITVRYNTDFGEQTHSSARGPRFGVAEVQRRKSAGGTTALGVWVDADGGSAAEMASRFGRDLEGLLAQANESVECSVR